MGPSPRGFEMKSWIAVFMLLISLRASGDPADQVLAQIDSYLGSRTFFDEFLTGDLLKYHMDERFNNLNSTMAGSEQIEALPDQVKVSIFDANGRVIRVDTLRKADWEGFAGNYARLIMRQIQSAGFKVDMQIVDMVEARIMMNGRPARLGAIKVAYSGANMAGTKMSGYLVISNQVPARGQIIVRHEEQVGVLRTWSVDSFDRHPTAGSNKL